MGADNDPNDCNSQVCSQFNNLTFTFTNDQFAQKFIKTAQAVDNEIPRIQRSGPKGHSSLGIAIINTYG